MFGLESLKIECDAPGSGPSLNPSVNTGYVSPLGPEDEARFEELLSRMRGQSSGCDPFAARIVTDSYLIKVNKFVDDRPNEEQNRDNDNLELQCEQLVLSDGILNDYEDAFRLPRTADDFLELLYSWSGNLFNDFLWPQEHILKNYEGKRSEYVYGDFQEYMRWQMLDLFCAYYKKLKSYYTKEVQEKSSKTFPGTIKYTSKEDSKWIIANILVDYAEGSPDYGQGICIITNESHVPIPRRYFGSVTECRKVQQNQKVYTVLTVKLLESSLENGEQVEILSLFNFAHYFYCVNGLINMKDSRLARHITHPSFYSSTCGLFISSDEKRFGSWDLDCIQKALDTVALSIPDVAPYCLLDFRHVTIHWDDYLAIVAEIFAQINEKKDLIFDMNPSFRRSKRLVGFCVSSDRKNLIHINSLLKAKGLKTYYVSNTTKDGNEESIKIAKNLVTLLLSSDDTNDQDTPRDTLREILSQWEDLVHGKFPSIAIESTFKEFINYGHLFLIRQADVILGHIVTLSSNEFILAAQPQASYCIVVDSDAIVESSTWSLCTFGCEKFIFMSSQDSENWPRNRSFFCKLISMFENIDTPLKGAKSCVIYKPKRSVIPEPPKDSRHKKMVTEKSSERYNKPHDTDCRPERRKRSRQRKPYCPKTHRPNR